jgi:hypothetical protein
VAGYVDAHATQRFAHHRPSLRVPCPGPRRRGNADRLLRRPGRHAGPARRDRGRRAVLPHLERELRRGVREQRTKRRDGGGGAPGCRRPARGEQPGRDQVRRQHDDADVPREPLDRGDAEGRRRDPRDRPRPRGQRVAVASHRRRSGADGSDGRRAPRGLHAGLGGLRCKAQRANEAGRLRLGIERRGDDQPGWRARAPRPRRWRTDLRRRGPLRPARTDRRDCAGDRLPGLLGVQVLRAARRDPVWPLRGPRPAPCLQGASGT